MRFKLFDSIVSSTLVYGLETTPLTSYLLERINVTQRTMLRKMVGWICYAEDTWEDRGKRMSERLQRCLKLYPLKDWSEIVNERKAKMIERKHEWPYWTKVAVDWSPCECIDFNQNDAYRVRGHPHQRWDD